MIQWVMKRDGRKLDHQTLETIRIMAVERVREGEAPSAVIASYGFSRTSIYRWLAAASKPGVGVRALASRPAPDGHVVSRRVRTKGISLDQWQ